VVRVQGASATSDGKVEASGFHRDARDLYTVGVAFSTTDSPGKEGDRVHYMALGGRHRRATVDNEPGIAHYCGSPQGRTPDEAGPSGATLVSVDSGKSTLKFLSSDVVRWAHESIEVTATTTLEQLDSRLNERLDKIRSQSQSVDQLVQWHIRGVGPLTHRLRPGGDGEELLASLRRRGFAKKPFIYSVGLASESAAQPPEEWYDQETILGDLLRTVREFETTPGLALDIKKLLPDVLADESLRSVAKIRDREHRAGLIERAKKLGLDLLTSPAAASRELQSG
jgi:DNA repair exonuclease SbcCD nuclease subunit